MRLQGDPRLRRISPRSALAWLPPLLFALSACAQGGVEAPAVNPTTPQTHQSFLISSGPHATDCTTCHGAFETFKKFDCLGCHAHEQAATDRVHNPVAVPDYGTGYQSGRCYACHKTDDGVRKTYSHAGIAGNCTGCHDSGAAFAALPVAGLTHPDRGGADCQSCHVTTSWKGARGAPGVTRDPAKDVRLDAWIPTFNQTSVAKVTKLTELLPMPMDHQATAPGAAAFSACLNCHATAGTGSYFPGVFHQSLVRLKLAQPATCLECHATSVPTGFVGPFPSGAAPPRMPPSGEMAHDAVVWSGGGRGQTALVAQECSKCHVTDGWGKQASGASPAPFHQSLGAQQPTQCLDCHASTRPTSAAGWQGNDPKLPFDYGTNPAVTPGGALHGAGLECITCHAGPGTGTWSGTQNWQGGNFDHTGPLVAATCITCHQSQRPDLQGTSAAAVAAVLGFDHSVDGRGDCFACHQETVKARRFSAYGNPTAQKSSGDWRDGQRYPGDTLATSGHVITAAEVNLVRVGNLIDHTTQVTATLFSGMLHTSGALPAALNAGPSGNPDSSKCWHCHTSTNGVVTAFSNGLFHQSLANFSATPGGAVSPFPQPTAYCLDCHVATKPLAIVEKGGLPLQPMDHAAAFAAPATVGGVTASGVASLQCAACHSATAAWTDGRFHASIRPATPADCVSCHYPLMADPASADVARGDAQAGTQFSMKHKSAQLTFQSCETCHTGASPSASTPIAAASWSGGAFHASLQTQPTACTVCHQAPPAATQSLVTYALPMGRTTSNSAQWMNHSATDVAGRDCITCHQADARKAASNVWSKSSSFHQAVTAPADCRSCHGLTNGGGSVPGTNNNLPDRATDSATLTTAGAGSGVPATVHAQLAHADVNVAGLDCKACHTQNGKGSGATAGAEWAQATFHAQFSAGAPLVLGDSSGRCSTCHINEKPTAAFATFDHAGFTSTSGTQDCASCHAYPGTGSFASPNWLGAAAVPKFINVGGFVIPQPPAQAAGTLQAGISNLPHPTVGAGVACTTCHATSAGGKQAKGYDHASNLAANSCNACHEAGSNLVGTVWNLATNSGAGNGDTRPFTLTTATASYQGNTTTFTVSNHFFAPGNPVDCSFCHVTPLANGNTGGFQTNWKFLHPPEGTCTNSCRLCHVRGCP